MTLTYTVTGRPNPKAVALLLESVYRFLAEREECDHVLDACARDHVCADIAPAIRLDADNEKNAWYRTHQTNLTGRAPNGHQTDIL